MLTLLTYQRKRAGVCIGSLDYVEVFQLKCGEIMGLLEAARQVDSSWPYTARLAVA